jgi:LuxR family maltose regulon positive regulatory protein
VSDGALPESVVNEIVMLSEGWMTGVVLGARAATADPGAAPDRHVIRATRRYLVEEVLNRQRGEVRAFLLATAPAGNALAPGLCNGLSGRDDSAAILSQLAHGDDFTEPLAGRPGWYRFHPLFAEALRAERREADGLAYKEDERMVAAWYWRHGFSPREIECALLSERLPLAMRLTRQFLPDLTDIPEAVAPVAPGAEPKTHWDGGSPSWAAFAADIRFPGTPTPVWARDLTSTQRSTVLIVRAAALAFSGHAQSALDLIDKALDLTDEERAVPAGGAAPSILGGVATVIRLRCLGALGRLKDAEALRDTGVEAAAHGVLNRADLGGAWADVLVSAGYVHRGRAEADAVLERPPSYGVPHRRLHTAALRARAAAHLDAGEVDAADSLLTEALAICTRRGMLLEAVPTLTLHADVALAQGSPGEALERLRPPLPLEEHHFLGPHLLGPLAVGRFRAWLALGDLDRAALETEACTSDTARSHARAVLDLARDDAETARERLSGPIPDLPRQAVEHHLLLARALATSDPGKAALHAASAADLSDLYGVGHTIARDLDADVLLSTLPHEPLSPAELRVLRMLPAESSTREVAERLYISRDTVRAHLKHIYRKLGVHDRAAAVRRGRDLGVL